MRGRRANGPAQCHQRQRRAASTAAKRKPQNNRYAAQRTAKQALRKAQGIQFPFKYPTDRREDAFKEKLAACGVTRSPELCIALAIFEALPEEARRRVKMAVLAMSGVDKSDGMQGASLLLNRISGHDPR